MAVPKKKISSSRRGQRRSHDALPVVNVHSCPKCLEPVLAHNVCASCGTYNGKQIIENKEETIA